MPARKSQDGKSRIAVVRVRGLAALGHMIIRTLDMLNLSNKNWCVVVDNNPSNMGMIAKVKDYVTFGEVSEEVYKDLVEKRAEPFRERLEDSNSKIKYTNYFTYGNKKYIKSIRLSPPKGGYGRRGIKHSFANGGALGNRGDKINDLLKRMI